LKKFVTFVFKTPKGKNGGGGEHSLTRELQRGGEKNWLKAGWVDTGKKKKKKKKKQRVPVPLVW